MPAVSKAQRIVAAIAKNHPDELYERNKGMLSMSKEQLHDFAATKEKGLPKRRRPLRRGEFRKGGYDWRNYE